MGAEGYLSLYVLIPDLIAGRDCNRQDPLGHEHIDSHGCDACIKDGAGDGPQWNSTCFQRKEFMIMIQHPHGYNPGEEDQDRA